MKKILAIISVLLIVVSFTACEKVIDVDLNSAAKKYVIEGIVTDQPGSAVVMITQTKDFDEDNNFPGVSGATVTVTDNGVPMQFEESGPGVYTSTALTGISGHEYKLAVKIGAETFTSSSRLPAKVNFDTMFVKEELFFGKNRYIPNIQYNDPAGAGNAYRFVLYRNGTQDKTIFVINDDYADNRINNWQLLNYGDEDDEDKIRKDDTITVDMFCLDIPVYNYWFSTGAAAGGGEGGTPANPVSNIAGGALGYFSAHTIQRRSVVVN